MDIRSFLRRAQGPQCRVRPFRRHGLLRHRPHQGLRELGETAGPEIPLAAAQRLPASGIRKREICPLHPSSGRIHRHRQRRRNRLGPHRRHLQRGSEGGEDNQRTPLPHHYRGEERRGTAPYKDRKGLAAPCPRSEGLRQRSALCALPLYDLTGRPFESHSASFRLLHCSGRLGICRRRYERHLLQRLDS